MGGKSLTLAFGLRLSLSRDSSVACEKSLYYFKTILKQNILRFSKKEKESYPYTRMLVMKVKWTGQGNPLILPPSRQTGRWGGGSGPPL